LKNGTKILCTILALILISGCKEQPEHISPSQKPVVNTSKYEQAPLTEVPTKGVFTPPLTPTPNPQTAQEIQVGTSPNIDSSTIAPE